jgi:hypothetical protein
MLLSAESSTPRNGPLSAEKSADLRPRAGFGDGIILISADKDFHPAAEMVDCYGKKVAIFRPLGFADITPPFTSAFRCST